MYLFSSRLFYILCILPFNLLPNVEFHDRLLSIFYFFELVAPSFLHHFVDSTLDHFRLNTYCSATPSDKLTIVFSLFTHVSPCSTACIKLEEFQTAKAALETGASLAPGNTRFTNLIKESDERIAGTFSRVNNFIILNIYSKVS